MPQDQTPESEVARAGLARMIADGHVVPVRYGERRVPPAAVPLEDAPGAVPPEAVPAHVVHRVPGTSVWNIGDAVRTWVVQALAAAAHGDRLGWDVSLTLVPAAGGVLVSAYALVVYMPSAMLGQPALGVVRILPDHPDQNEVRKAVLSAVGELREQRSKMLRPHG